MKGIHSISCGDQAVLIMHVPQQKKVCLAIMEENNKAVKVGSFTNETDAYHFLNYLAEMVGAQGTYGEAS